MSCAAAAQGFRGTTFYVHFPASDGRQEPQTLWLVLYETMFLNILQGTKGLLIMFFNLPGVSYWRVPHELIECWTLEERPLLGSLRHMAPIRKRLSVLC